MNKVFVNSIKQIKKYSSNSIFYKYLKVLTVILLIPFITLNFIAFAMYSNSVTNEIESTINKSFLKTANIFETAFNTIENNYISCVNNSYMSSYMLNTSSTAPFMAEAIANLRYDLTSIKKNAEYIMSISIYNLNCNYVMSDTSSRHFNSIEDFSWYNDYISKNMPAKFITNGINNQGYKSLLFCYSYIYDHDCIGFIVFDVNMDTLLNMSLSSRYSNEILAIYNSSRNLIFTSTDEEFSFPSNKINKSLLSLRSSEPRWFVYEFDNSEYFMVQKYNISSQENVVTKSYVLIFVLVLLSIFLAFTIAIYMSFQFYNSISKIMASFYTIGVEDKHEQKEKYDEIQFITKNIMKSSLSQTLLEKELSQKMLYLQNAQHIALQTQFTPHFLFNTLNHISIALMNTIGKQNPISKMIHILSELLSIALDTKDYTTTIKTELDYAKKYLELESIKHDDNFDVRWDIDESLLEYITPKFILQPIIENCFMHGINPLYLERRGVITISVKKSNNDILISIADNGVGISNERLEQINKMLSSDTLPETRHIGLCNVNQRINLIFKGDYGCNIYSTPPGTTVTIHIPQKKLKIS